MKTLLYIIATVLISCSVYTQPVYTTDKNPLVITETTVISIGPIFKEGKSPSKQRFTVEVKSEDIKNLKLYVMPIHGDRKLFSKKELFFLRTDKKGYSYAILPQKFLFQDATDVLLIIEGTGTIDDIIIKNKHVAAKPVNERIFINGHMYLY